MDMNAYLSDKHSEHSKPPPPRAKNIFIISHDFALSVTKAS